MTIDDPKDSGSAPSGYTCVFTHAPGLVLCDFCKPVESEVERLTEEVERLRSLYDLAERQYAEQTGELETDRDRYKAAHASTQRGLIRMEVQRDEARTERDWWKRAAEAETQGRQAEVSRLREQLATAQDELIVQNRSYRRLGAERDEKQFEVERLRRWVDRFRAALKPPEDGLSEEEADLVETAMRAVEVDSAGHWPTVAGWLHVEVVRLRGLLAPRAPVSESVPATPQPEFLATVLPGHERNPRNDTVALHDCEGRNCCYDQCACGHIDECHDHESGCIECDCRKFTLRASAPSEATPNLQITNEINTVASSPPSGGDSDTTPRVWTEVDLQPCPEDVRWVRDCNNFVWRRLVNDQWMTGHHGDGPCGWPYLIKKFGPLTELPSPSPLPQEGGTDT